jgi:hypothetical protein
VDYTEITPKTFNRTPLHRVHTLHTLQAAPPTDAAADDHTLALADAAWHAWHADPDDPRLERNYYVAAIRAGLDYEGDDGEPLGAAGWQGRIAELDAAHASDFYLWWDLPEIVAHSQEVSAEVLALA